ncbi:hypothetical protein BZA77DRAFT_295447 [Pyronema omphalodes]|nr:hypothetical protein BZA77DRAFT_295447 [Pyronema omphalodes]
MNVPEHTTSENPSDFMKLVVVSVQTIPCAPPCYTHDVQGCTGTDVTPNPSPIPVLQGSRNLGETIEEEPEDLDRDIQIFLGIDNIPGSQATLSNVTSIPPRPTPQSLTTDINTGIQRRNNIHRCPEQHCRKSFASLNALNRHISSIHKRPGISCPFCPGTRKVFNRSDNFQSAPENTLFLQIERIEPFGVFERKKIQARDEKERESL